MAETNAPPSREEVLLVRNDLRDYADRMGRTVDSYITEALEECKRILEDDRGVVWFTVFNTTDDEYFDNADTTGRNQDRIQNAISHMTASMVFRDYAIRQELDENWTQLADYHETKANDRLLKSKLDIDTDESGAIEESEEGRLGQSFMVR